MQYFINYIAIYFDLYINLILNKTNYRIIVSRRDSITDFVSEKWLHLPQRQTDATATPWSLWTVYT